MQAAEEKSVNQSDTNVKEDDLKPVVATVTEPAPEKEEARFTGDIPSWNFTVVGNGGEKYPKFIKQFDDENYLKAERMALLGLKRTSKAPNSKLNK